MRRSYIVLISILISTYSHLALAAHDGKHLFFQYCAACHGFEGKGGMGVPLSLPDFLATVSDDYLAKSIRLGRPGRVMPAFNNLSNHEIDMIVGYIRSWSDASPATYSPDLIKGNVENGKALFSKHCASCHGDQGQGGPGTGVTMSRPRSLPILAPALNNPGFLKSAPDALIKATLTNGRKGTPMISFLDQGMSEQEIDDIVAYIRSFETQAKPKESIADADPIVIIRESQYSVEQTVENLKNAVQSMNFRLIRVQNLDTGIVEEGKEDKKQVIVYSCNFNMLNEALKVDPRVGLFLPCRVTVSEHDGKVLVMYTNPKRLNEVFNNSELDNLCTDMQKVYEDMIDEALL